MTALMIQHTGCSKSFEKHLCMNWGLFAMSWSRWQALPDIGLSSPTAERCLCTQAQTQGTLRPSMGSVSLLVSLETCTTS